MLMRRKEIFLMLLVLGVVSLSGCTSIQFNRVSNSVTPSGIFHNITNLLIDFGLPEEAVKFPNIIWRVITPFLSVWLIVYAFMKELRIFRRTRWINGILSLLIVISTIWPLGFFISVVNWLFSFLSIWAVIVFVAMFTVGVYFLYIKRSHEWGTGAAVAGAHQDMVKGLKDDLASKRLELIELREKISRTANPDRRASLEVREDKVKQEVQDLVNRIQELAESYRS